MYESLSLNHNSLSYKEISDILKSDDSPHEFMQKWEVIVRFIRYADGMPSVLDGIAYFDDDFIVENRLFLADIFELAESLGDSLCNMQFSWEERNYLFNRAFEEAFFEGLDEETIKVLRAVFDVEEVVS